MYSKNNMSEGERVLRSALNYLINSRSNEDGMFAGGDVEYMAYIDACGKIGSLFPRIG